MIIENSNVRMSGARTYSSVRVESRQTMTSRAGEAAVFDLSEEGKSLMQQMDDIRQEQAKEREERQRQNAISLLQNEASKEAEKSGKTTTPQVQGKEQMQVELLRKMIAALQRMRKGKYAGMQSEIRKIEAEYGSRATFSIANTKVGSVQGTANVTSRTPVQMGNGTLMTRQTVVSGFFSEQEVTAFSANGMVRTADGREISFGVSFEMSHAFAAKYEFLQQEDYLLTDPLVINMDASVTKIGDQKFYFDLDSDGKEEEMSFVGNGSGFLALDKNNDGKINDGSELFGTKSGDGFKDLAVYDEDGNGWIDEADDIFKDLKVWVKDEDGSDRLLSLKEAGVGAIYLGSTDTQHTLRDGEQKTQAVIQKSGVYLKENGEVGTVQHVDFAL